MPFEFSIDRENRIISVVGTGVGTLEDALQTARELVAHVTELPGYGILSDSRDLDYRPSIPEITEIARALFDSRALFRARMAIVVERGVRENLARIFAAMGNLAGTEINIFTDESDALEWLQTPARGRRTMLIA